MHVPYIQIHFCYIKKMAHQVKSEIIQGTKIPTQNHLDIATLKEMQYQ